MPTITIEHQGEKIIEVAEGTRLVLAIEKAGVDIGHRCGGYAKCTTCRVEFQSGEPETMTEAEAAKLEERELTGVRLSCQIAVDGDMTVRPVMTVENQGWSDPGPEPEETVTPEPVWTTKTAFRRA
jgi:ferredoxin